MLKNIGSFLECEGVVLEGRGGGIKYDREKAHDHVIASFEDKIIEVINKIFKDMVGKNLFFDGVFYGINTGPLFSTFLEEFYKKKQWKKSASVSPLKDSSEFDLFYQDIEKAIGFYSSYSPHSSLGNLSFKTKSGDLFGKEYASLVWGNIAKDFSSEIILKKIEGSKKIVDASRIFLLKEIGGVFGLSSQTLSKIDDKELLELLKMFLEENKNDQQKRLFVNSLVSGIVPQSNASSFNSFLKDLPERKESELTDVANGLLIKIKTGERISKGDSQEGSLASKGKTSQDKLIYLQYGFFCAKNLWKKTDKSELDFNNKFSRSIFIQRIEDLLSHEKEWKSGEFVNLIEKEIHDFVTISFAYTSKDGMSKTSVFGKDGKYIRQLVPFVLGKESIFYNFIDHAVKSSIFNKTEWEEFEESYISSIVDGFIQKFENFMKENGIGKEEGSDEKDSLKEINSFLRGISIKDLGLPISVSKMADCSNVDNLKKIVFDQIREFYFKENIFKKSSIDWISKGIEYFFKENGSSFKNASKSDNFSISVNFRNKNLKEWLVKNIESIALAFSKKGIDFDIRGSQANLSIKENWFGSFVGLSGHMNRFPYEQQNDFTQDNFKMSSGSSERVYRNKVSKFKNDIEKNSFRGVYLDSVIEMISKGSGLRGKWERLKDTLKKTPVSIKGEKYRVVFEKSFISHGNTRSVFYFLEPLQGEVKTEQNILKAEPGYYLRVSIGGDALLFLKDPGEKGVKVIDRNFSDESIKRIGKFMVHNFFSDEGGFLANQNRGFLNPNRGFNHKINNESFYAIYEKLNEAKDLMSSINDSKKYSKFLNLMIASIHEINELHGKYVHIMSEFEKHFLDSDSSKNKEDSKNIEDIYKSAESYLEGIREIENVFVEIIKKSRNINLVIDEDLYGLKEKGEGSLKDWALKKIIEPSDKYELGSVVTSSRIFYDNIFKQSASLLSSTIYALKNKEEFLMVNDAKGISDRNKEEKRREILSSIRRSSGIKLFNSKIGAFYTYLVSKLNNKESCAKYFKDMKQMGLNPWSGYYFIKYFTFDFVTNFIFPNENIDDLFYLAGGIKANHDNFWLESYMNSFATAFREPIYNNEGAAIAYHKKFQDNRSGDVLRDPKALAPTRLAKSKEINSFIFFNKKDSVKYANIFNLPLRDLMGRDFDFEEEYEKESVSNGVDLKMDSVSTQSDNAVSVNNLKIVSFLLGGKESFKGRVESLRSKMANISYSNILKEQKDRFDKIIKESKKFFSSQIEDSQWQEMAEYIQEKISNKFGELKDIDIAKECDSRFDYIYYVLREKMALKAISMDEEDRTQYVEKYNSIKKTNHSMTSLDLRKIKVECAKAIKEIKKNTDISSSFERDIDHFFVRGNENSVSLGLVTDAIQEDIGRSYIGPIRTYHSLCEIILNMRDNKAFLHGENTYYWEGGQYSDRILRPPDLINYKNSSPQAILKRMIRCAHRYNHYVLGVLNGISSYKLNDDAEKEYNYEKNVKYDEKLISDVFKSKDKKEEGSKQKEYAYYNVLNSESEYLKIAHSEMKRLSLKKVVSDDKENVPEKIRENIEKAWGELDSSSLHFSSLSDWEYTFEDNLFKFNASLVKDLKSSIVSTYKKIWDDRTRNFLYQKVGVGGMISDFIEKKFDDLEKVFSEESAEIKSRASEIITIRDISKLPDFLKAEPSKKSGELYREMFSGFILNNLLKETSEFFESTSKAQKEIDDFLKVKRVDFELSNSKFLYFIMHKSNNKLFSKSLGLLISYAQENLASQKGEIKDVVSDSIKGKFRSKISSVFEMGVKNNDKKNKIIQSEEITSIKKNDKGGLSVGVKDSNGKNVVIELGKEDVSFSFAEINGLEFEDVFDGNIKLLTISFVKKLKRMSSDVWELFFKKMVRDENSVSVNDTFLLRNYVRTIKFIQALDVNDFIYKSQSQNEIEKVKKQYDDFVKDIPFDFKPLSQEKLLSLTSKIKETIDIEEKNIDIFKMFDKSLDGILKTRKEMKDVVFENFKNLLKKSFNIEGDVSSCRLLQEDGSLINYLVINDSLKIDVTKQEDRKKIISLMRKSFMEEIGGKFFSKAKELFGMEIKEIDDLYEKSQRVRKTILEEIKAASRLKEFSFSMDHFSISIEGTSYPISFSFEDMERSKKIKSSLILLSNLKDMWEEIQKQNISKDILKDYKFVPLQEEKKEGNKKNTQPVIILNRIVGRRNVSPPVFNIKLDQLSEEQKEIFELIQEITGEIMSVKTDASEIRDILFNVRKYQDIVSVS